MILIHYNLLVTIILVSIAQIIEILNCMKKLKFYFNFIK
jgi:hypothetical protein